jgi:hypothetical protein
MENPNEATREQGRIPKQPSYPAMGMPQAEFLRQDPRYKSPVLATLMSLIPGLGQAYIGFYQQGFINIMVIAGLITMLANDNVSDGAKPFLAIFMVFYWFFNLVDAYRKSTFYNQALLGLGALEFPEGEKLPGSHGSLFGGVALIIAGMIALSYTLFNIPMEWLGDWWPLALILMGVYLLFKSIVSRNKLQNR